MSAKSIVKISETKKDYSACHTEIASCLFYLKKEVKIHFEHEFIFYHVNFMLRKCTFLAVLV